MLFFSLESPEIDEPVQLMAGINNMNRMIMIRENGQVTCLKHMLNEHAVTNLYLKDVKVELMWGFTQNQQVSKVIGKFAGFRKPRIPDEAVSAVPELVRKMYVSGERRHSTGTGHDLERLTIHTPNLDALARNSEKIKNTRKFGEMSFTSSGILSSHLTGLRIPAGSSLPLCRFRTNDGYDRFEHIV